MARGQQQQQQQGPDSAYAPVWIIAILFFVSIIIWHFFHGYIVAVVFKVRLLEIDLIQIFAGSVDRLIPYLTKVDPMDVSYNHLIDVSSAVGYYLRYPVLAILASLGIILYLGNPTLKFRKTYSMNSLRDAEYVNWPQIHPVLKLDLVNTPINQGPWAMSIPPMEFAQQNKLLRKEAIETKHKLLKRRKEHVAAIRRGEAKRVFTMQLGPYWEGVESLPIHMKALLAIFMAKHNRDREAATNLSNQINRSAGEGQLNFSGAEALLKKHIAVPKLQKIMQNHAYVLTVMASMLKAARDDGVLPTAEFIWLKPIDRVLWYMLNCVGRQTPFPEVAGPFAHWLAELELQHKVLVPLVDEAVNALEKALKEIKLQAGDDEIPT